MNSPASTILDGSSTGRVLDLYTTDKGDISVDGFTVQNGSTPYAGGGICAVSNSSNPTGDITITNNIIRNNMATNWGGGIAAGSYSDTTPGNVTIVNNVVTGNTVGTGSHAGGVAATSSNYSGPGTTSGTVTFINNTVINNAADTFAGGVHVYAAYTGGIANFYNNIIRGNTASSTADFYVNAPTTNGYNNNYHVGSTWTSSGGNIDADPAFIGGGDYHLQTGSPCIDTGLNTAPGLPPRDGEGNTRIFDGNNDGNSIVDMGAFEYGAGPFPILYATFTGAGLYQYNGDHMEPAYPL